MCPSSPSGGVHFGVLASSIRGTPVSLTSLVTFSPRQMSCSVTSGWRQSVKMWSCLCLLTLLMVLPKEHRFGVKREMMCDDRGDTDRAWLRSMRWPWHGERRDTLFIISVVDRRFQEERQRNGVFVHVRMCFWHLEQRALRRQQRGTVILPHVHQADHTQTYPAHVQAVAQIVEHLVCDYRLYLTSKTETQTDLMNLHVHLSFEVFKTASMQHLKPDRYYMSFHHVITPFVLPHYIS